MQPNIVRSAASSTARVRAMLWIMYAAASLALNRCLRLPLLILGTVLFVSAVGMLRSIFHGGSIHASVQSAMPKAHTAPQTYMIRLPELVVMAASSSRAALVIGEWLSSAGVPVITLGEQWPAREVFGTGNGVVLMVTGLPHGLPSTVPIVFIVQSPLYAAALSSEAYPAQSSAEMLVVTTRAVTNFAATTREWTEFGRLHKAKFSVIHFEDIINEPYGVATAIKHGLGLVGNSSHWLHKRLSKFAQLELDLRQKLAPLRHQMCEALQVQQNTTHTLADIGCYAMRCNVTIGDMAKVPCLATVASAESTNFKEFADTKYAPLVSHSQRRYIKTTRRVVVITGYHTPKHNAREAEYHLALRANLQNPYIDEVHLMVSPNDPFPFVPAWRSKLFVSYNSKQPTYSELVQYANDHCAGDVAVITNTDIVFTASIEHLHNLQANMVYALSRQTSAAVSYAGGASGCARGVDELYQDTNNFCVHYLGSHDTFAFIPPLRHALLPDISHVQNLWGAENVVIWALAKHNYTVLNPCKSIVCLHVHCSDFRSPQATKRINVGGKSGVAAPTYVPRCYGAKICRTCWVYKSAEGRIQQAPCL